MANIEITLKVPRSWKFQIKFPMRYPILLSSSSYCFVGYYKGANSTPLKTYIYRWNCCY